MQQAPVKPRISTAKLHDTLSKNMGREAAHVLVEYLEGEMPTIVQDSVKYLATKEDVAKVETKLTEKINGVENKLTEKINGVETKLTEKINGVETQVANVRSEIKEDIAHVKGELTATILQVQVKMEESFKVQTRWMIGVLLTLMGLIVTLYMKK